MDIWTLPERLTVDGTDYPINWEYRQVLSVLAILSDESKPLWQRWFGAVARFYAAPVPAAHLQSAMAALSDFITMGRPGRPGPKLFDWALDAPEIISDINRVAGCELRKESLHWWTFLGWFHAIGEGQLSFLVGLRSKLRRGEKLTQGEQEFYRQHPDRVKLPTPTDPEKQRLEELLNWR